VDALRHQIDLAVLQPELPDSSPDGEAQTTFGDGLDALPPAGDSFVPEEG
jgi:hypothetical protein